jgi:hypothetical protein
LVVVVVSTGEAKEAPVVVVALIDGFSQLLVEGARLTRVLAEQVAPLGSQAATWQVIDLYPLAVFQVAFGHHQVDVRFEAQVAPARVKGVDHADANARVEILHQFTDSLRSCLQEHFQERAVGVKVRP